MNLLRNCIFRNLIAMSTVISEFLVAFKPSFYSSGLNGSFAVFCLHNGKVLDATFHNH